MSIQPSPSRKSQNYSKDMISNLPDSILSHILSFLPTVDAVSTCILSTKWKNHWTNLHTLTFDDTCEPFDCDNVKFVSFVNRVLHFTRENSLVKFSLMCRSNSVVYDISKWISISIMKGVRELDLSIMDGESVRLPGCFFNSATLEVLMLFGRITIKVPTVAYLPNLRKMELFDVDYEDDESARKLISCCTSLDYLDIGCDGDENIDTYIISSSTLRFLRYDAKEFVEFMDFLEEGIRIDDRYYVHSYLCCKTLEELHLSGMTIKGTFCLPNLRVLNLNNVKFENDESASNLINSFSSLESLVIDDLTDVSKLKISSSTLRDLKLEYLYNYDDSGVGLVFDAPALQHLNFYYGALGNVHIKDLSSLIDVVIHLEFREMIQDRYFNNDMCILFRGLCNVEVLSLSWMCSRMRSLCQFMPFTIPEHKFPQFLNLSALRMEVNCSAWPLLQHFIKNSNALEDLVVYEKDLREEVNCGHILSWKDPEIVPECLLSSFRILHFYGFQGFEHEIAMVEYFLKNARVMRRMVIEIFPSLDNDIKMTLCQKLLKFHRASEECEISVCSDGPIFSLRDRC